MHLEHARQLRHRIVVLVDPEVHQMVVAAAVAAAGPNDQERRRFAAPAIAARRLRGREACHEQLRERPPAGLERVGDAVDDRRAREDVALRGITLPGPAAGPREAFASGVGRGAAVAVDDSGLALLAQLVLRDESREGVAGRGPPSSSARPFGPYVTFANDWVAIAPTSARAHGTTAPTARNFDWVATPRSPVAGSSATIEYVTRRPPFGGDATTTPHCTDGPVARSTFGRVDSANLGHLERARSPHRRRRRDERWPPRAAARRDQRGTRPLPYSLDPGRA